MADTQKRSSYSTAFLVIIFTFFFWGFVAASNQMLVGVFKDNFKLSQAQSQLVESAFYLAYFVGSLLYFFISMTLGDPLNRIGYKKGLVIGLIISALGALLFIPAVNTASYGLFLAGLFVIGLGFALLQIVANPFVINLGDPSKGSHRLNFAGGINSFGTTIGPVLLAFALYGNAAASGSKALGLVKIKTPYVILSIMLIALAILISFVKMPVIKNDDKIEKGFGVFKYPQLAWGMLAIFIYVGTEVTIGSNLTALLKLPEIKGIDRTLVDKFISLYWGSLMIGRISGSLHTFNLSKWMYRLLSVVLPFAVLGIIMLANILRGADVSDLYVYTVWIVLFIIIKFLGQEKPSRTLLFFGISALIFMLIGLSTKGNVALFSFISGGLFCSVMWPCIFNLAIAGLGKYTNQGSSLLIMMILGGAVLPWIQGRLADISSIGIHLSYIVPVVGFAYLAWYGFAARKMLQKQGIDYDASIE